MAKATLTRADELRKVAGRSRGPTAEDTIVVDLLADFDEVKDALTEYAEKVGNIELDDLSEIAELAGALATFGMADESAVSGLMQAADAFQSNLVVVADPELAGTFEEAYDAVMSAWDSYVNVKESDRYDGKADDVQAEWDEVASALHSFADLCDELGLS